MSACEQQVGAQVSLMFFFTLTPQPSESFLVPLGDVKQKEISGQCLLWERSVLYNGTITQTNSCLSSTLVPSSYELILLFSPKNPYSKLTLCGIARDSIITVKKLHLCLN